MVQAARGDWTDALNSAVEWRNRSLENPKPADVQIADARLHLNDASGALKQLEPWLAGAKAAPAQNAPLLRIEAISLTHAGRNAEAQSLLQPLLSQDVSWRAVWLQLAVNATKSADEAADWIHQVESVSPDTDAINIAFAWSGVGERFKDAGAYSKATALLEKIIAAPNAPADAYLVLGSLRQQAGKMDDAIKLFRSALAVAPASHAAKNNLAYLLLLSNGDLKEAASLSEQAVTADPNNSAYHDTLARIKAKGGDWAGALDSFQTAVRADSGNIEAMIGLADSQIHNNRRDKAGLTLQQIDTMLQANPTIDANAKAQLDAVREAMKTPADGSKVSITK